MKRPDQDPWSHSPPFRRGRVPAAGRPCSLSGTSQRPGAMALRLETVLIRMKTPKLLVGSQPLGPRGCAGQRALSCGKGQDAPGRTSEGMRPGLTHLTALVPSTIRRNRRLGAVSLLITSGLGRDEASCAGPSTGARGEQAGTSGPSPGRPALARLLVATAGAPIPRPRLSDVPLLRSSESTGPARRCSVTASAIRWPQHTPGPPGCRLARFPGTG